MVVVSSTESIGITWTRSPCTTTSSVGDSGAIAPICESGSPGSVLNLASVAPSAPTCSHDPEDAVQNPPAPSADSTCIPYARSVGWPAGAASGPEPVKELWNEIGARVQSSGPGAGCGAQPETSAAAAASVRREAPDRRARRMASACPSRLGDP